MENYFEDYEANKAINEIININKIKRIGKNEAKKELLIGKGSQSIVFSGTYKNEEVAIKYLLNADWKSLAHELVIVSCIRHESLPLFYGFIYDNNSFALVFERLYGTCLDQVNLNKLSDETKISILKQLCFLLDFLHNKKIIHRDLKPENIILDDFGKIYLIDYGISRVLTKDSYTETIAKGTIHYMAPECFDSTTHFDAGIVSKITTKVDVWGFGCIISYLFSGVIPWTIKNNVNDPNILKSIKGKVSFPIPENITNPSVFNIIQMATKINVEERATMIEIRDFIETFPNIKK
jgi:serine/threonine protein kinase